MRELIANIRVNEQRLKSVFEGINWPSDQDSKDICYWTIKVRNTAYDYYNISKIETDGKTIWSDDYTGKVEISFFFCINGDAEQEFLNALPSQELRDKYYLVQAFNHFGYGERNPNYKIYRFGKGREVVEL